MTKLIPNKPFLLLLYGFPGSGKTYLARQLCDNIQAAHVQADRIRHEVFDEPRYTRQENAVVLQIMNYMVGEFLKSGMSVVYDMNALRLAQRRMLRDMARKAGAEPLLLWQQIDSDSALNRSMKRDRRKTDDRYAMQHDSGSFQKLSGGMQNPEIAEDYVVVSGKHPFKTQLNAILRNLYQKGVIAPSHASDKVTKPGLVNLVPYPHAGRVDMSRRNITIR